MTEEQKTKWVKIDLAETDWQCQAEAALQEAAQLLQQGELVAFPTETVYGLGGNALLEHSAKKIYAAKGRPSDNPLIVHIAKAEKAEELAEVSPLAKQLMAAFFPGPLTLVLPKKPCIPYAVTGGLDTVAIRNPQHPVALALLERCQLPIAAPSANLSGKPSPTTGAHVYHDLAGRIAMVLDSGSAGVGLESTVLDVTADPPVILRPGAITQADLLPYCGQVLLGGAKVANGEAPKAPGMKYKHYAPRGQVVLSTGEALQQEYAKLHSAQSDKKLVVLATQSTLEQQRLRAATHYILAATPADLVGFAQQLFAALRWCDEQQADVILVEAVEDTELGCAIMNRLRKAAGKK